MKEIQMFLLPYAGGNSASFNKLIPLLNQRIEIHTVEYSGRLTRRNEGYITDYEQFLQDVVNQIDKLRRVEVPYVLLGYSLGSVLAYDIVSRHLLDSNPIHLFICAKGSLFSKASREDYSEVSEEEFAQEIIALGGTDERIRHNKRFMKIYMEPVKADFVIWGNYQFYHRTIPSNSTVLYCSKDPASYGIFDWSKIVIGNLDYFEMGENHFFINECTNEMAEIINSHLVNYIQ